MFPVLPSTSRAIEGAAKTSPFYKELEGVVVTGVRKPTETIPVPPKKRRILGLDEPVFYAILGVAALGAMIYMVRRS